METPLLEEFAKHKAPSETSQHFISELEKTIAQDLWQSAGGHWSEASIETFRSKAMEKLSQEMKGEAREDLERAWVGVVRDFHQNFWGEKRLQKKEKKPQTEEDRIFWELFSYIWVLLQAVFITKTAVFYFGIQSAREDTTEGKVYVVLAILFSFVSLMWFAYRKSKKKNKG